MVVIHRPASSQDPNILLLLAKKMNARRHITSGDNRAAASPSPPSPNMNLNTPSRPMDIRPTHGHTNKILTDLHPLQRRRIETIELISQIMAEVVNSNT
jgi:hypothetical protein